VTRPGALLTTRDKAMLRTLADYRQLSVTQLHRLHFRSRQTATRRLRQLAQAGLMRSATVQGYPERIVVPTAAGLAAAGIASDRDDVGRLPAGLFLRHALAVAEFRIALTASVQLREGVELLNFVEDAERYLGSLNGVPASPLRSSVAVDGAVISHAPDAAFALRRAERVAAFYVEMDMGTEVIGSPKRGVGKFVRFYRSALAGPAKRWLKEGLQLEREPDAVLALVVTSSPVRAGNIRSVCGAAAASDVILTRIRIADSSVLQQQDVLGPQWCSLDPTDERRHAIVTDEGGRH